MRASTRRRNSTTFLVLALAWPLFLAEGCITIKSTGTSRSGTEQLLLTGTWDTALCKVDFRPLAGSKVFLDPQYVTVVDKDWVLSSIRRKMAGEGVLLEAEKDKAQLVLEPAVGVYGTDERNCTSGLPQIGTLPVLTGPLAGSPTSTGANSSSSTALTISQYNESDAVVKVTMFAYDAKTGRLVWDSGPVLTAHGVRDRFLFGLGPMRSSSLPEVQKYPQEAQTQVRMKLWKP